jgi:hypothetical protein
MSFEISRYIDIIHPKRYKEAIPREAKVEDARMAAAHIALSVLLSVITTSASIMFIMQQADTYSPDVKASMAGIIALEQRMFLTPLGIIVSFVTSMLTNFIALWVIFGACKALGGKGGFGNQLYVTSMIMLASSVIFVPLMLLNVLPIVDILASIAGLALGIYVLYLVYLAARAVHTGLDSVRAVIAVIAWIVASGVMGAVVFFARAAIGI